MTDARVVASYPLAQNSSRSSSNPTAQVEGYIMHILTRRSALLASFAALAMTLSGCASSDDIASDASQLTRESFESTIWDKDYRSEGPRTYMTSLALRSQSNDGDHVFSGTFKESFLDSPASCPQPC